MPSNSKFILHKKAVNHKNTNLLSSRTVHVFHAVKHITMSQTITSITSTSATRNQITLPSALTGSNENAVTGEL
jgi:hypothetical protein